MKLIHTYHACTRMANRLTWLPLLLIRLVLAYGFYQPALMKLKDISSIADWFGSMGIPLPAVSAWLAAGTEITGVVLLTLGLGVRLISVPLIFTMLVAIVTVHWNNGFEAGNNGFEIPLYYILMLLTLILFGAGKASVDYLIRKRTTQAENTPAAA